MTLLSLQLAGQLEPGKSREWLLTNGTGAYASSTVIGCNTRRYHGLLIAALHPPVGRVVMLSRVQEMLTFLDKNEIHELSVNEFVGGTIHPRGDQYLKTFQLGDSAEWTFSVGGATVSKNLMLHPHHNGATLVYTIDPNGRRCKMQLAPFLAMRDFHALRRGTDSRFEIKPAIGGVNIKNGTMQLKLVCRGADFKTDPDWWTNHEYAVETERGQDHIEDLFTPGQFTCTIDAPTTITLRVTTGAEYEPPPSPPPAPARMVEQSPTIQKLMRGAHDFVVARTNPDGSAGRTVMAGYPWFADWGRDTMISLPGLLLCTQRLAEARDVLRVFSEYVSQGMIPNRFNDYSNEPEYNTVDASLWFIHACYEYFNLSKDWETFERDLLPACHAIIDGYTKGTRYNIAVDPADGLVSQGDQNTQLTWMDAKMGDIVFTPRQGKPVEINALWYHALVLLGRSAEAAKVKDSFVRQFIRADGGLYDVVQNNVPDSQIRPNQIFAVSLPNSPLSPAQQKSVVDVVQRELLTPYGLRTLSPSDPGFRPLYTGNQFARDGAYHNGTIWPWLIGPFLDAYLRVNNNSAPSIAQAKAWLAPLIGAVDTEGCLGQIAEIYEATEPYRPVGCFAQAWSIAEVLRLSLVLKL